MRTERGLRRRADQGDDRAARRGSDRRNVGATSPARIPAERAATRPFAAIRYPLAWACRLPAEAEGTYPVRVFPAVTHGAIFRASGRMCKRLARMKNIADAGLTVP